MLNDRDKNAILKIIGAAVVVFIIVWYFGSDDGEKTGSNETEIQNQTARGHPTLKGWGMLRAARFG
jgi:hypothetical protein